VFSDGGKSVFLNALVKMTASVTDVFCITQITYIVINNALLIDQSWFWLLYFEIIANLTASEHRL
jgi:hypothetical protein